MRVEDFKLFSDSFDEIAIKVDVTHDMGEFSMIECMSNHLLGKSSPQ
jgi:hypothetical protein